MPLSGSFSKSFGPSSRYALKVVWSATQDQIANKSTVTTKIYVVTKEYASVNYSATKSGNITIDGKSNNFNSSVSVNIGANAEKLIQTNSEVVTHDAEGKKTVKISGYVDLDINLSGQSIGRVSFSDTVTLTTIPRQSRVTNGYNFTAGEPIKLTISRSSTSFSHEAEISLLEADGSTYNWVLRIPFTTSQTTREVMPTPAEISEMFEIIKQRTGTKVRIVLQTFQGDTMIGEDAILGNVLAPNPSFANVSSFTIGNTISSTITRANAEFTHTVELMNGSTRLATMATGATNSFSYSTSGIKATIEALMKNVSSKDLQIKVTTFYNGVQVGQPTLKTVAANISNASAPIFSNYTYRDTNSTTIAFTGDNQAIVQNKSTLQVTIPLASRAIAQNGATMEKYQVVVNGIIKEKAYSSTADVVIDFGVVNAASNVAVSVEAVDSRGLVTRAYKTVTIIPYKVPVASLKVARLNSFESLTNIIANGSFSPMTVNGVNKNAIQSVSYYASSPNAAAQSVSGTLAVTANADGTFTAQRQATLPNVYEYEVTVTITDKMGSIELTGKVAVGRPIFYIDDVMRSLGFNDFPDAPNQFMFNGQLKFGSTSWASAGGGIDMNNSDIVKANGIYFNDVSNNQGEGLLFPKTGTPEGSTNTSLYDTIQALDGKLTMNGQVIATDAPTELWSGASYLQSGVVIVPTRKLSECANGWILLWSDYDVGGNSAGNNYHWAQTVIHKGQIQSGFTSGDSYFMVPNYQGAKYDGYIIKAGVVTDSSITGDALNNASTGGNANGTEDRRDAVLRKIYAF